MLRNFAHPASEIDADRQFRLIDRVSGAQEGERCLMGNVLSLAAHPLMRLAEPLDRLRASLAARLAPPETALRRVERAFGLALSARRDGAGAIGPGRTGCYPHIYAGFLSSRRQGLHWRLRTGDGPRPPVHLPSDRDRLGRPPKRAMHANADTPDLRQAEDATVSWRAGAVGGRGEAAVAIASMEARRAQRLPVAQTLKEGLKRAVETAHDILQDLGVDVGRGGHDLVEGGRLRLLLRGGDRDTTPPARLPPLLLRSGVQLVAIGVAEGWPFHASLCCLGDAKSATGKTLMALAAHPAFIPMPEGRGFAPFHTKSTGLRVLAHSSACFDSASLRT